MVDSHVYAGHICSDSSVWSFKGQKCSVEPSGRPVQMLEKGKCEMAATVCSGGEGGARRQLGLGEAWPAQEAPGVKSKAESSCKEKREAGEHGHMRLRSSKTLCSNDGGFCSSPRGRRWDGWSELTSLTFLLYPFLQHTFSPLFPPFRKAFPVVLVQVTEKFDLFHLMLNMSVWVAFPIYLVPSALG